MSVRIPIFVAFAAFLTACPLLAQEREDQQKPTFDAKIDAVTVDVLVTKPTGTPISGMKKEEFRIYEDDVEQEILNFFAVDAPFSVGLVLDTSYSAVGKLAQIQNAAIHFINSLHFQDEVMVISFDDEVYLDTEFTENRDLAERAIKSTRTGNSTQVYEAVWLALDQMQQSRLRRVLVIFTDGVDTASHETNMKETLEQAKESSTLVYTVFFDTERDQIRAIREAYRRPGGPLGAPPAGPPPTIPGQTPMPQPDVNPLPLPTPRAPRTPRDLEEERRAVEETKFEYRRARKYLEELSKLSGGGYFKARGDVSDLREVFEAVAKEMRSLYTLTFVSSNPDQDGEYRKLEVRCTRQNTRLRHREGYLAPER